MPDFPCFTPQRLPKLVHEGNSQQSPRESQSPWEAWKFQNEVQKQLYTISDQAQVTHRQLVPLSPNNWAGVDFYPFKIYQFPASFRTSQSIDDWRLVRVRSGNVLTSIIDPLTCSIVVGTDGVQMCDYQIYPAEFPTGSEGPGINGSLDILVDSGSLFFWLWVETTGSNSNAISQSYYLRYGSTPIVSSYGNPHPWTSFPKPDGAHTVIGYVDSFTGYYQGRVFIRQYQRTDIMASPVNYITMSVCDTNTGQTMEWWIAAYPFTASGG